MRLGPKFERLIRQGERPALTDPKVEEGQLVVYDPGVLEIEVGKRTKANQRSYLVRDHRPRLLARSLGYSHSSANTIKGVERTEDGYSQYEPEAVSEEEQKRITKIGTENWQVLRATEIQRQKIRSAANRLREMQAEAAKSDVDLTRIIEQLEAIIEQGRRELKKAA